MNLRKYTDKIIELSVLSMVLIIPVIFFTKANDVFEINKMFTMRFFSLLAAVLFIISSLKEKRISVSKTDFDFPLLGFLAASVLTTFITNNIWVSIFGVYEDFAGIITVLNYTVLFYLVVNYINNMKSVYKSVLMVLAATLLICAYGIAQNFGWDFVRWNPETYSPERFFSTLGNPNFLAAYLVESMPILFILFFITHKRASKFFVLGVLLSAVLVLFLTKSRAGFISFLVTVGLIGIYTWIDSRKTENELFSKNKGWFIALAAGFIVFALFSDKVQGAFLMLFKRTKLIFTSFTLTPRLYIWKSALMMFKDSPLLGKGLDTFQVIFPYYRLPIYWQLEWNGTPEKTHNIFLQVLATQGVAGFGFYALLIITFLKKTYNLVFGENDLHKRYIIFGLFMAAVAYFIQGLFNYTVVAYGSLFWIAMGMIAGLDRRSRRFYTLDYSGSGGFAASNSKLLITVVSITGVVITVMLVRFWMADMYFKIGNIGVAQGKEIMAAPYYKRSVLLNPYREIYWVKYGIAFEKAMRKEQDPRKRDLYINQAVGMHSHTIQMNSMNGYNFNNLARVYKFYGESVDKSKFNDAVKMYNEAIKRDPNNAYFGLDLATVYINTGQWDKALQLCDRYIELYPNFATPYSYKGYIYMLRGKEYIREAKKYYEQAVDGKQWFRDIVSMSSTYSNLGIIYINMNMPEKAIKSFEEVVKFRPDYKEGYLNLGHLYSITGDTPRAIQAYERVLAIDPNDDRARQPLNQLKKGR